MSGKYDGKIINNFQSKERSFHSIVYFLPCRFGVVPPPVTNTDFNFTGSKSAGKKKSKNC